MKVLIHEFAHICHFEYNHHQFSMTWFDEALATNLSHQYDSLNIDCSLDDLLNGIANYNSYYTMGKYLLDNYDSNYILKLAKKTSFLETETKKVYDGTIDYIKNNQSKLKQVI